MARRGAGCKRSGADAPRHVENNISLVKRGARLATLLLCPPATAVRAGAEGCDPHTKLWEARAWMSCELGTVGDTAGDLCDSVSCARPCPPRSSCQGPGMQQLRLPMASA